MNFTATFFWELGRVGPVGLVLGLVGLAASAAAEASEPGLGVYLHGVFAGAAALLLGVLAGGVEGQPTADFFLSRNVSRLVLNFATATATLVALAAALLVPMAAAAHWATAATIAVTLFAVTGACAGLGRLTGHSLAAMPVALATIGAVSLLDEALQPGQIGFSLFCAFVGLLGFVILILFGGTSDGRPASRRQRHVLILGCVVSFASLWGVLEHLSITPAEAADEFVFGNGGWEHLDQFRRAQAEAALVAVQPRTQGEMLSKLTALVIFGSASATPLLIERWTQLARTKANLFPVDAMMMTWWPAAGRLQGQSREMVFEWAERRAAEIAHGKNVGQVRPLMRLTARLDLERAAALWMPAISKAISHDPHAALRLFRPSRCSAERASHLHSHRIHRTLACPVPLVTLFGRHLPPPLVTEALRLLAVPTPIRSALRLRQIGGLRRYSPRLRTLSDAARRLEYPENGVGYNLEYGRRLRRWYPQDAQDPAETLLTAEGYAAAAIAVTVGTPEAVSVMARRPDRLQLLEPALLDQMRGPIWRAEVSKWATGARPPAELDSEEPSEALLRWESRQQGALIWSAWHRDLQILQRVDSTYIEDVDGQPYRQDSPSGPWRALCAVSPDRCCKAMVEPQSAEAVLQFCWDRVNWLVHSRGADVQARLLQVEPDFDYALIGQESLRIAMARTGDKAALAQIVQRLHSPDFYLPNASNGRLGSPPAAVIMANVLESITGLEHGLDADAWRAALDL